MEPKNALFNRLLAVVFLLMILHIGCSTTTKKPLLIPIESGIGLSEILDPNQLPDFRDNFDKGLLLESINNSIAYFKKIKSYPITYNSIGFSPEKQIETLEFFKEGYIRCNNPQERNEFISDNFRVFQAVGKKYEGKVHFTGYGTPIYDGSLTPTETFRYPLYSKPANLRKPYFTLGKLQFCR